MNDLFDRIARRWLAKRGFSVVPTRQLRAYDKDGMSEPVAPPAASVDDEQYLRKDNPQLLDLVQRYDALKVAAALHSQWNSTFVNRTVSLARFRAHSAYVWSYNELPRAAVLKYFLFADDVRRRAGHILEKLSEDAAFGCLAYDFPGMGIISRDRLDSAQELEFVDRHTGLLSKNGLRVLDIGAGYGRLAHRVCEVAHVAEYTCLDAVPESTFLCDFYLKHRGIADRSRALPLDHVVKDETQLGSYDIAFNVHSWSECTLAAITWWTELLGRLKVPYLYVVPNQATQFLTVEPDKTKKDFRPAIEAAGYRLVADEDVFPDPTVKKLIGVTDRQYLFKLG